MSRDLGHIFLNRFFCVYYTICETVFARSNFYEMHFENDRLEATGIKASWE